MTTILNLPIELQHELIKTCHQSGQEILAKLSQLNRFYYQLSIPLLNSKINLNSKNQNFNLNQLERFKYDFIPFHRLEIKSISFKFLNHCDFKIDENLSEILSLIGLIETLEISYDFVDQLEENYLNTIESISNLLNLNTLIIKGSSDSQNQYPQVSLILKNLSNLKNLQKLSFQKVQILVLPDEFNLRFNKGTIDLELNDCEFSTANNLEDLQKLKNHQIFTLNSFLKIVSSSLKSLKLINLNCLENQLNLLEFNLPNLLNIEFIFVKEKEKELNQLNQFKNQFNLICFQSLHNSNQLISLKINYDVLNLNYLFKFHNFFQFQQILYS